MIVDPLFETLFIEKSLLSISQEITELCPFPSKWFGSSILHLFGALKITIDC